MKYFLLPLLAALALCSCATSSIDSRRTERRAVYDALPPETKSVVDQGQVKIGMSTDAVYIAWGQPSQILTGESERGSLTTWLYLGTTLREHRYWAYRYSPYHRRYYEGPYMEYDYYPENYTRAEVVFENGVVKSWRNVTPPR